MGEVRCHCLSAASSLAPCLGPVSTDSGEAEVVVQAYRAMITTAGGRSMALHRRRKDQTLHNIIKAELSRGRVLVVPVVGGNWVHGRFMVSEKEW